MDYEPKFLSKLEVTPLADDKNWQLVSDLKFQDANGFIHCVQAGFVTDFASIPSLSRVGLYIAACAWITLAGISWYQIKWLNVLLCCLVFIGAVIIWLSDLLNGDDLLDAPATLHDDGYKRQRLGQTSWTLKFYWDWILFIAMRANGEPLWKCWLIWFNVAAFGWFAWYQDGRNGA